MVQKLKVDEFKMYLRLRDLKVSGKKAELVARVFAASENHVPVKKTAEEVGQIFVMTTKQSFYLILK